MGKIFISYFCNIIETTIFTYYIIPAISIIWLLLTPNIPFLSNYQAIKDICGLIATIMSSILGLFFAIVMIAINIKDKIKLRIIYYEGLLQIGSLLFLSLLTSSIAYFYVTLIGKINRFGVVFIIGLFLFALFRLLDLLRTTLYFITIELKQS